MVQSLTSFCLDVATSMKDLDPIDAINTIAGSSFPTGVMPSFMNI